MKYQYYIADVFTDRVFNGAQIAVFPNADGLNAEKMALIARELNLSETVFIFHKLNADDTRRMRIFRRCRKFISPATPSLPRLMCWRNAAMWLCNSR